MVGQISLEEKEESEHENLVSEGDRLPLGNLEAKIESLLVRYQGVKKERDEFAASLELERDRANRLEKRLEAISLDREKVKTRIDQLLLRLKSIDM
jgi:chromosome segregation ATPase